MRAHEVANRAGITYRQLDFWVRSGLVHPHTAFTGSASAISDAELAALPEQWRTPAAPGSGTIRQFTDQEAAVIAQMAALVRAGLEHRPAVAMARQLVEHPGLPVLLAPGWLVVRSVCSHPDDLHPYQAQAVAAVRAGASCE